jgi:hypothetical protein
MPPPEHRASRIILDGERTERHGYAGQASPAGVAFVGTVAPITATPAIAAATAVLVSVPRTPDAITQLIRRSSLWNKRATLPFAILEVSKAYCRRSAADPRAIQYFVGKSPRGLGV